MQVTPHSLNGYGSFDPDGDRLTYAWALVSAPTDSAATDANFTDVSSPNPEFTWDEIGTYTFQLQVHDGTAWSAPDLVDLTIGDILNNQRPIANAGDSVTVEAPLTVSLHPCLRLCRLCSIHSYVGWVSLFRFRW